MNGLSAFYKVKQKSKTKGWDQGVEEYVIICSDKIERMQLKKQDRKGRKKQKRKLTVCYIGNR